MRNRLLAGAVIASLSVQPAFALERLVDGVLGGLAGALVGGPVGLIAGGLVGATAGPEIASGWGLKNHRSTHARSRRHYAR